MSVNDENVRVHKGQVLGKGAFGTVFKATLENSTGPLDCAVEKLYLSKKEDYTLPKIERRRLLEQRRKSFEKEVDIFWKLSGRCDRFVVIIGHEETTKECSSSDLFLEEMGHLVCPLNTARIHMECCELGSLRDYLNGYSKRKRPRDEIQTLASDL
ncbi:hypothetical protein AAVH_28330, partial [Aphelenchoides avenae]